MRVLIQMLLACSVCVYLVKSERQCTYKNCVKVKSKRDADSENFLQDNNDEYFRGSEVNDEETTIKVTQDFEDTVTSLHHAGPSSTEDDFNLDESDGEENLEVPVNTEETNHEETEGQDSVRLSTNSDGEEKSLEVPVNTEETNHEETEGQESVRLSTDIKNNSKNGHESEIMFSNTNADTEFQINLVFTNENASEDNAPMSSDININSENIVIEEEKIEDAGPATSNVSVNINKEETNSSSSNDDYDNRDGDYGDGDYDDDGEIVSNEPNISTAIAEITSKASTTKKSKSAGGFSLWDDIDKASNILASNAEVEKTAMEKALPGSLQVLEVVNDLKNASETLINLIERVREKVAKHRSSRMGNLTTPLYGTEESGDGNGTFRNAVSEGEDNETTWLTHSTIEYTTDLGSTGGSTLMSTESEEVTSSNKSSTIPSGNSTVEDYSTTATSVPDLPQVPGFSTNDVVMACLGSSVAFAIVATVFITFYIIKRNRTRRRKHPPDTPEEDAEYMAIKYHKSPRITHEASVPFLESNDGYIVPIHMSSLKQDAENLYTTFTPELQRRPLPEIPRDG